MVTIATLYIIPSSITILKTLIDLLIYQRLPRIFGSSWFKSEYIITKHLIDLKHQHLAGAFFLALALDSSFE